MGSNPISSTKIQPMSQAAQKKGSLHHTSRCDPASLSFIDSFQLLKEPQRGCRQEPAWSACLSRKRPRVRVPSLPPIPFPRPFCRCTFFTQVCPSCDLHHEVRLLRKYAFPKRDSDIYDLFQLHYLACEQFVFVTRDGTLMSKVQQKYAADLLLGSIAQEDDVRFGRAAPDEELFPVGRPTESVDLLAQEMRDLPAGFAVKGMQPQVCA